MGKRTDFGADWNEVVAKWYLGRPPRLAPERGWEALGIVERLCSERLDDALKPGVVVPALVSSVIETGFTLEACEGLVGFDPVLQRVRSTDRAALAELEFASALVRLGYTPVLGPPSLGGELDVVVEVENKNVYAEVICPELSDEMRDAFGTMTPFANELRDGNPGKNIDVYLLVEPDQRLKEAIADVVRAWNPGGAPIVHEIPGAAFIRCEPFSQNLTAFEPVEQPPEVPNLVVVAFTFGPTNAVRATVKMPLNDERVERLVAAERHHFSRDERNVLVVDVSGVPGGLKGWPTLIRRRLQPTINRRFGGVILFEGLPQGVDFVRRWRVLRNPYAYKPVPDSLLNRVAALDEP